MGRASRRRRDRRLGLVPSPPGPASSVAVVDSPASRAGDGKISKALLDIVKPFLEDGFTLDQMRRVVKFGALVWNLSLFDEERRNAEADRIARGLAPGDPAGMRAWIGQVLDRKATLHPGDRRCIVSTEVVDNGDEYRVFAAGAAPAA